MEISTGYGSQATSPHEAHTELNRVEKQSPSVSVEKLKGEQLKGRVLEISSKEAPPTVTVKLFSGEIIKAPAELQEGVKAGDYVKFIMQTDDDGQPVMHGMSRIDPKTATDPRLSMMANALETAGLKADEANLKLVSMLVKNELPINKEAILAFSKMVRFAGPESAQKALLLMKNDMPMTLGTLEKLNAHTGGEGRLLNKIQELAESIMEMENGPEKQRLLNIFSASSSEGGAATGGAPQTKLGQQAQLLQTAEQPQGANTAQNMPAVKDLKTLNTNAEFSGQASQPAVNKDPNTGTRFFREIFGQKQDVAAQLAQSPAGPGLEKFIEKNIDFLKSGFESLSKNGTFTKENAVNLVKSAGEAPFNPENTTELKDFFLLLAEKGGFLKESIERAGHFERAIKNGAKRIAESLSVSLDEKDAEIENAVNNIKKKLSLAASGLGDGKDVDSVRRGIEDIKESLKFVNNFKNNTFLQIPIVLDGKQREAELYVFPRKGGKGRGNNSQSALVALDLANLGHFEAYIRKTEQSVVCQFRLEKDGVEELVKENIERLHNALRDKRYSLDGVTFKRVDERFTAEDEEPVIAEDGNGAEVKGGRLSFDYKT